ncbi:MAG: hypothetical protein ABI591_09665 [Kofleriaceae bacterium]
MIAAAIAVVVIALFAIRPVSAELDNQVFTSRGDRIRLVVPRGWRASDAPSYPGLLLWLMRPEGKIVLTAEPFTRELYCSWPIPCRTSHEVGTVESKLACALRQKLVNENFHIGPIQAGPKDNEAAGLPSVWFDFDDGKHFMRQAVALGDDRAFSLVLSASSAEARTGQSRAFEQTLRTLRPLTEQELGAPPAAGTVIAIDGGVVSTIDATIAPDAEAAGSGGAVAPAPPADSVNAPPSKINPIGPCSK